MSDTRSSTEPAAGGDGTGASEGPGRAARSAIARNALSLALGQAATTTLAIVLTAALGRYLGAADFGLYYLIVTMSTSAYVLVEWGQPLLVIREAAREPARAGELLGTALALRVAFALVIAVPSALVTLGLGYGVRTTWLFLLLLLTNLPLFLAQGYGMVFRAYEQMGREAAVSVTNKVLILCVVLPALALGAGIPGFILGQAIAGTIVLVLARRLYSRMKAPALRVSRETARYLFVAGLPMLSMSVTAAAQPYLEVVILSKLAPAATVGWFGAARNILGTLIAPAVILGAASYPRIARAAHDAIALPREVQIALRPLLWLGALAGTGTFLFAETAVGLIYGSGFGPASTNLKVLAPALFLVFLDVLIGHVLYAIGAAVSFAVVLALKVAASAALSYALVPMFQARVGNGGLGVVLAFALAEVFVLAGGLFLLRRGTLSASAAVDAARAVGAAGLTVLLFEVAPAFNPWLGIPLCVVAFAGASWLLGLMRRRDVETLLDLVRRPRGATVPRVDLGDGE